MLTRITNARWVFGEQEMVPRSAPAASQTKANEPHRRGAKRMLFAAGFMGVSIIYVAFNRLSNNGPLTARSSFRAINATAAAAGRLFSPEWATQYWSENVGCTLGRQKYLWRNAGFGSNINSEFALLRRRLSSGHAHPSVTLHVVARQIRRIIVVEKFG